MSVTQSRAIVARLRALGVTVIEHPGCYTRGNGQTSAYVGGIMHHTAGDDNSLPVVVGGRPNLPPPLCNTLGRRDGSIVLVAAHPANHAGASGGRSMGPLPVTTLFNKRVWGHEIDYPGLRPMSEVQYWSAVKLGAVLCDVLGVGAESIRAHAETSVTGKWDPGRGNGRAETIDMGGFRNDIKIMRAGGGASPAPSTGDDMPSIEEVENAAYRGFRNAILDMRNGDADSVPFKELVAAAVLDAEVPNRGKEGNPPVNVRTLLEYEDWRTDHIINTVVAAIVARLSGIPGVSNEVVASTIRDVMGTVFLPAVLEAVRNELGEENAEERAAVIIRKAGELLSRAGSTAGEENGS